MIEERFYKVIVETPNKSTYAEFIVVTKLHDWLLTSMMDSSNQFIKVNVIRDIVLDKIKTRECMFRKNRLVNFERVDLSDIKKSKGIKS